MSIASSIGNNLTTNGVFTASAVNNTSVTNVTDFASVPGGGVLKLLSTQTASASATIDFTSGIDSTYDSYVFKFINIHPASVSQFQFQANSAGETGFNETITSTSFQSFHREDDSSTSLNYRTGDDQAQGTGFQILTNNVGDDADQCCSGYLQLFNPSSTTYVKHFISRIQVYRSTGAGAEASSVEHYSAGYFNTTSAIDEIQFKMSSGNIDDGIIKMYGVV
jgi:hypothetical protein